MCYEIDRFHVTCDAKGSRYEVITREEVQYKFEPTPEGIYSHVFDKDADRNVSDSHMSDSATFHDSHWHHIAIKDAERHDA